MLYPQTDLNFYWVSAMIYNTYELENYHREATVPAGVRPASVIGVRWRTIV